MRTVKLYKSILLFVVAIGMFSCVQDDDFEIPNITLEAPILDGKVLTIGALRSSLDQQIVQAADDLGADPEDFFYDNIIAGLRETEELLYDGENILYVEGYVVSNDEAGNFFEEFIMQDEPSNPTNGIRVLIDVSPLFTYVEFGRRVYVKLNELTVKYGNGVLSLGIANGRNLAKIPEPQLTNFIIRDTLIAGIEPKTLSFSDFNDANTNLYIRLGDVQFELSQILGDNRLTYAGGANDQFDGERILESCETGQSVVFSTSTFADFKSLLLPIGNGSLDGLLIKNFFGEEFNITINDPTAVHLNNEARCDPALVDCGIATSTESNVLFSEFFETQNKNDPVSGNGWTNFIEEGTETWEAFFDDSANASLGLSARMGSFNSGDAISVGWLITPEIDFEAQELETLNFKTSNSFSDGSELLVLVSLDWDGIAVNIPSASWSELPAAFIVGDTDFFADWFPSGNISLDCIEGAGHIAFKYIGSGNADFDGTYELDEIEINAN